MGQTHLFVRHPPGRLSSLEIMVSAFTRSNPAPAPRRLWQCLLALPMGTLFAGIVLQTSVVAAEVDSARQARALKQAIVAFAASALTLRESLATPPPHLEVLFEVEKRGESVHAHHLPGWLRISLDKYPAVEHTYTDKEWHALADGALHLLLTAPFTPGNRTLTVHFKGIDRNGRPYLRTKTFSLETARPSDHRVLKFRAAAEEPTLTLDTLGESLLRSPTSRQPSDELLYRIGLFESASESYATAAAYFLAALDSNLQAKTSGTRTAEIRFRLAEAYAAVGSPEEAEAMLERVANDSRDPSLRARAWLLIERIASREGRHHRVLEAYERLGPSPPSDFAGEAHTLAGLSALAVRAYPQAAAFFRAVPKSDLDSPLALFGQAQALSGQGDAYTAATLWTKLGETRSLFNPVQSRVTQYAHAALGLQLLEQGRCNEAMTQLGRVPTDHPLSDLASFAIGWCLREIREHVKAIAVFEDLLSRAPGGRYAHEARLASAASYADLRATTRSVAAYRAALDALGASSTALDRLQNVVQDSRWDPLADTASHMSSDARRLLQEPGVTHALERYRWLVRFGQELQRAIDRFPGFLAAPPGPSTLGGRLHTVDGSHLVNQGHDLLARLDVVKKESRNGLSRLIVHAIALEQERLEEWSVAASLGIARNLRDDMGGEVLTVDE
jgi:tetratricopeptide (TPR) repeat protein